jgi:hypothetical protein
VSPSAVKSFELGRRHPKESTLNALIDALGLTRDEANPMRRAAGHPDDWFALFQDRYPSDTMDIAADVRKYDWPVFITNQAIDVVYANSAFEAAMGVDLSREFRGPGERNFLAQASNPRFVGNFANFDELVTYMIGLVKGDPRWHQSVQNPAPWMQGAMQKFLAGDQKLVQRVLELWSTAPPLPHRARHTYTVQLRAGSSTLRLQGSTSIADLWNELSWNEWVPEDGATWEALTSLRK